MGLQTMARQSNPAHEAIHPACQAILQTANRGPNPAHEYIL